jgi:glycerol kinase
MPYVLALDEGTTSARAALYNDRGQRLAMHAEPLVCEYPHSGWVQQDADAIWGQQLAAARRVLEGGRGPIAPLGITNQRETTIVWDRRTGKPVAPAIVWQCRRTAEHCAELARSRSAAEITAHTGLVVDAYFSGTKIAWILEHTPDARARAGDGELLFGTVDTWLIWKLTNGAVHATDSTNASRTLLMNLESGDWDDALLATFGVPRAMLPKIVPSSGVIGETAPEHLGQSIPIAGIAGDQQAALAGQACWRPGLAKNTYGTGCFALMHTGGKRPVSRNRLLATRAASTSAAPQYAIEGSVFIAGAAVQWLRDKLGLISTAAETAAVAASVPDTKGVYLVPAFVGLGSPHWDAKARGIITGLTQAAGRPEIVRAALEGIAYQTRELVDAMQADSGASLKQLRVDGGAAANDFLMQFQADILGCEIARPADVETTALGAAFLAGLAPGEWQSTEQLEALWGIDRVFTRDMTDSRRDELYAGWKDAVARARSVETAKHHG